MIFTYIGKKLCHRKEKEKRLNRASEQSARQFHLSTFWSSILTEDEQTLIFPKLKEFHSNLAKLELIKGKIKERRTRIWRAWWRSRHRGHKCRESRPRRWRGRGGSRRARGGGGGRWGGGGGRRGGAGRGGGRSRWQHWRAASGEWRREREWGERNRC